MEEILVLPSSAEQVTIEQWADFRIEEDKYFESNDIDDLIAAVKVFFSDNELSNLPIGKWEKKVIKLDNPTFIGLYQYLNHLVSQYQPKLLDLPFKVNYKGVDYELTAADTALVMGLSPVTLAESVTLLELQRLCGETYEDLYNLKLEHMAVLLRPKGDKIPLSKKDRADYISKNKMNWLGAPMSIAIDVQHYFNVLITAILGRYPSAASKPTKEAHEYWDRVGWNSIHAEAPKKMGVNYKEAWELPFEDVLAANSYAQ